MIFRSLRRAAPPISLLTFSCFLLSFAPRQAMATEPPAPLAEPGLAAVEVSEGAATGGGPQLKDAKNDKSDPPSRVSDKGLTLSPTEPTEPTDKPGQIPLHPTGNGIPKPPEVPLDLPTGQVHTGVSSQSISVPQGAGKIQGMGESFSAQLSTGIGTFTIPISLPPARGAASPSLALSYSSSGGHGTAGVGWSFAVPYISRQTDRRLPRYQDPAPGGAWHAEQDRFVFNGGQELIPICLVGTGGGCAGKLTDEVMPSWADGWQYFRPRVEGSFQRFFWSPDHRTWVVQDKSGVLLELGAPLDGTGYDGALETHPSDPSRIFQWNLVRQGDVHVAGPFLYYNAVVYRYRQDGDVAYLEDIYDTPPGGQTLPAPAALNDLTGYAHHTHLVYETRPDSSTSFRRGWQTTTALRLTGIDVASKTFTGTGARKMLRRYHLAYDPGFHPSLLKSVTLEGRPLGSSPVSATPEDSITAAEDGSGHLPAVTNGLLLPAMTFDYSHVKPFGGDGSPGGADLVGYEGFDERVHNMSASPGFSVDDGYSGFFDVNADALPDVLVTKPGEFGGKHGVFFQGPGGKADTFCASTMSVDGVNGDDTTSIAFNNPNLAPLDVDGDGIIDLLHMPKVKAYALYSPEGNRAAPCGSPWTWKGTSVTTASQQNPKIDFSTDAVNTRAMDVNGDGFVDLVLSKGTQYQTFLSLGRYAQGYGQFGDAKWTSGTSSAISNEPIATCVPWAGTPVQLSDEDVRIGDMNGDGYPDIVRIRQGDIRYWPGRGNGMWGTGELSGCPAGAFGSGTEVKMAGPWYSDINLSTIRLDDVNGDGLDDLVQVRFQDVDIWLNVDGTGWTPNRHILAKTPVASPIQSRVQLVDINGSGTRDIAWGDGLGYKYIDLSGGERPWILTHVENGLGKITDIEYASSPSLMLAAAAAGKPWTSVTPSPMHVVVKTTESTTLAVGGHAPASYVSTYEYRDPVYDGRQREFRGFKTVRARKLGDANSPSSTTESTFLLGECVEDEPGVTKCDAPHASQDNPSEALKGLPLVSTTFDDQGIYLGTDHHRYTLRLLYAGLDGREVRYAFENRSDHWSYDTGAFVPATSAGPLGDVDAESLVASQSVNASAYLPTPYTIQAAAARISSQSFVDPFGNATSKVDLGCVSGCGVGKVDEIITSTTTPVLISDWLWRTQTAFVTGSDHAEQRKYTETAYDPLGQPKTVSARFERSNILSDVEYVPTGGAAGPPANVTVYGSTLHVVGETGFDDYGNPTTQTGTDGHCRQVSYDEAFSDLATGELTYAGPVASAPTCGSLHPGSTSTLGMTATYDRGLGAVTTVTDFSGATTLVAYDGLGRLTQLFKPTAEGGLPVVTSPSVTIVYSVASPVSLLHTTTEDGTNDGMNAFAYVDGFGRTLVTLQEADTAAGDAAPLIANGLTEYDAKGAAKRAYRAWWYDGDPEMFPLSSPAPSNYGSQRYDAFGRQIETFNLDGSPTLKSVYHSLSKDMHDGADLAPGPHQGTYASVRSDGHGRSIATTERVKMAGKIETREVRTKYLPTGPPERICRVQCASANCMVVTPGVERWMRYDTQDRLLLNMEPNTTDGYMPFGSPDTASIHAWRYAYDDSGDLIATSDARKCGSRYFYDGAGRILGEDYSPCDSSQATYSAPDPMGGFNVEALEVVYEYDNPDPSIADSGCAVPASGSSNGRLTGMLDRGAHTLMTYDFRGRATCVGRQMTVPPVAPQANTIVPRAYGPQWYHAGTTYDAADRPVQDDTGTGNSVTTLYSGRGTVMHVGSTYGTLVEGVTHDADGLLLSVTYGDAASTRTDYTYDTRRRVHSVQTYRGPPAIWSNAAGGNYAPAPTPGGVPSSFQLLLEDLDYTYDAVDNPTEIRDWRTPSEWPAGAQPVTRKMSYDDLYRVTKVEYDYPGGVDPWTSPFAHEVNVAPGANVVAPSPQAAFDNRVTWQTWQYDWLGNTVATDDDAHGFYDRSLGAVTNSTGAARYKLTSATNASPGGSKTGSLTTAYDAAGNLTQLVVSRNGACLPDTSHPCPTQTYAYQWDELGRMSQATRTDAGASGAAATVQYVYDGHDQRVLKRATDAAGTVRDTVYVFDSLELRQATDEVDGGYQDDLTTQREYLSSHGVRLARVSVEPDASPSIGGIPRHVFLELQDHLGSTSLVVDKDTGELVEAAGYLGTGARESDYRPGRWQGAREEYGFTGKEEDVEVGLTYFGKRFLSPYLGRWVSPDPLAVHSPGSADLNLYAYVHGSLLKAVDPVGLDPGEPSKGPGAVQGDTANAAAAKAAADSVLNAGQSEGGVCAGADQNMSCGPTRWETQINGTSNDLVGSARTIRRDREESRRTASMDAPLKPADLVPGTQDSFLPLDGNDVLAAGVTALGKSAIKLGGKLAYRLGTTPAPENVPVPTGSVGAMRNPHSGELVKTGTVDADAAALADHLGGQPSVKFSHDPTGREFDAVSKDYIAQVSGKTSSVGSRFREQSKATFEAALSTERTPYFHFTNEPTPAMLAKLGVYADRYGITPVIRIGPLVAPPSPLRCREGSDDRVPWLDCSSHGGSRLGGGRAPGRRGTSCRSDA